MNDPATGGFAPSLPAPGEIIASKYEVIRVLGAGGMGVVVLARHLQLGQQVAIKFMRGVVAHDATSVKRFLREARAVVALSSDHVARVLDVGTLDSGSPYMVMEYLAGLDFSEVLQKSGPMAIADAVDAVLQACDALAEAHALGIVHRDLKPSNLFVTRRRDGTPLVKVLDFGISKSTELLSGAEGHALTSSGTVMGSPGYMSPEQVRSTKSVDVRSDIWSLGVILYELLTGVSPFAGDTIGEIFAHILSDPPQPMRSRRPDVPASLEALIFRCLERNIDRRVQNVTELAPRLVPFGSREAAITAERILRMTASPKLGGGETLAAPEADSGPFAPRTETASSWLQSGAARRVSSRARVQKGLLAALVALVLVAGGVITFRRTRAPENEGVGARPDLASSGLHAAAPSPSSDVVPTSPIRNAAPVESEAPSTLATKPKPVAMPAPEVAGRVGVLPAPSKPAHGAPRAHASSVTAPVPPAPGAAPDFGY